MLARQFDDYLDFFLLKRREKTEKKNEYTENKTGCM